MANKPDRQAPDPGDEQNRRTTSGGPPAPTAAGGAAEAARAGQQPCGVGAGWSREVEKIDRAIDEIKQLSGGGHEEEAGGESAEDVTPEDIEKEIGEIHEEMEEIGEEIDVGGELDEELKIEWPAVEGSSTGVEDKDQGVGVVGPTTGGSMDVGGGVVAEEGGMAAPVELEVADLAEETSGEQAAPAAVVDMAGAASAGPAERPAGGVKRTVEVRCRIQGKAEGELGQLWGNIFFSADQAAPSMIIVTAARRRDGATQIAASLALIGAEASRERLIALVDFNMRNPGVAQVLGVENQPGITDILEGRSSLDAAVQALALRNGNQLHVLTAGAAVDRPLGLLKSRQVQSLLGMLRDRYDQVIVDTAAANDFPDAQVIGAMSDGALLVVRAGETPRETVAQAKKRLDLAGVRCLGVVLNQRSDPIPGFLYRMT